MLTSLKLTYFRQHEDLTINLTHGLNVIRGDNEKGKTTLLEALAYAWYGSDALRNSLQATVTWGRHEKDLKVEATAYVEGINYRWKRGKSGAEVYRDDEAKPFVTGHTNVSAFTESLYGANASTAVKLMLSKQGAIRGALDQGPKATAEMIETLADFDLFERILTNAQARLPLGSTTHIETQIQQVTQRIEGMVEPEVTMTEDQFKAEEVRLKELAATKDTEAQALYQRTEEVRVQLREAEKKVGAKTLAQGRIDQLKATLERHQRRQADLESSLVDPAIDTEPLQRTVDEALDQDRISKAWANFNKIPLVVGPFMTVDEYDGAVEVNKGDLKRVSEALASARTGLAVAKSQVVTSSVCGFCGQDVSQFPEAAAKNAALLEKIALLESSIKGHEGEAAVFEEERKRLQELEDIDSAVHRAAALCGDYVKLNMGQVPQTVTWVGPSVSSERLDVVAAKAALTEAQTLNARRASNEAQLKEVSIEIVTTLGSLEAADLELTQIQAPTEAEIRDLEESAGRAGVLWGNALQEANSVKTELSDLQRRYGETLTRLSEYRREFNDLVKTKSGLEETVEQVHWNNALVKKIRAVRPQVSSELWNMVLVSVSTLFSSMRGTPSVVARSEDGFTINGELLTSFSGSTLDILGLAIRVALVKTFIPSCTTLILDEPSAACDETRTTSLLGFVAGCGFEQVIMVTHEDQSETVATNLIEL